MLAAMPILVIGPLGGFYVSIAATGLIYLSYFLCNLGVLVARAAAGRAAGLVQPRSLGHAREHPRPRLRRAMLINFALWQDEALFGDFGGEGRGYQEPGVQPVLQAVRQRRSKACRPGRSSRPSSGSCS